MTGNPESPLATTPIDYASEPALSTNRSRRPSGRSNTIKANPTITNCNTVAILKTRHSQRWRTFASQLAIWRHYFVIVLRRRKIVRLTVDVAPESCVEKKSLPLREETERKESSKSIAVDRVRPLSSSARSVLPVRSTVRIQWSSSSCRPRTTRTKSSWMTPVALLFCHVTAVRICTHFCGKMNEWMNERTNEWMN